MRTLVVVDPSEVLKAGQLFRQARRRRARRVLLQGQVQTLVTAVLLRPARLDPLRLDAGFDQLHRETRQSRRASAGKRRTVVRAHRPRQPELSEAALEDRPDMGSVVAG